MSKYEFIFTIVGYDLIYHLNIEGTDIDDVLTEFKRKTYIDGLDYGSINIISIRKMSKAEMNMIHDRYENLNLKRF